MNAGKKSTSKFHSRLQQTDVRLAMEFSRIDIAVEALDKAVVGTAGRWSVYKELDRGRESWCIKRGTYNPSTGKKGLQRLPAYLYRDIRQDKAALDALAVRLNHRRDQEELARKRYEIRSAFIQPEDLEQFRLISAVGNTPEYVETVMLYLQKYVLQPLTKLDPNPQSWSSQVIQAQWARFLTSDAGERSDGKGLSQSALRNVTQIANRFMKFMHQRYPKELPLILLEPLNRSFYRNAKAQAKLSGHM